MLSLPGLQFLLVEAAEHIHTIRNSYWAASVSHLGKAGHLWTDFLGTAYMAARPGLAAMAVLRPCLGLPSSFLFFMTFLVFMFLCVTALVVLELTL